MASSTVDAAAQSRADESDLDPAAFLKTVRELSEKREREDLERYRKLEEEIEQGKRERAARRADRARSISPQKRESPAPRSVRSPAPAASPSPVTMSPAPSASAAESNTPTTTSTPSISIDVPDFKGFGSTSRAKPVTTTTPRTTQSPSREPQTTNSTTQPSPSASSLARSGSLIWQQRPSPRTAGTRPVSMLASSSATPGDSSPINAQQEPSRGQIAASLGARDPTWFKRTADRGAGNAAFRRNRDEGSPTSLAGGRQGLPGMAREPARRALGESVRPASEVITTDSALFYAGRNDAPIAKSTVSSQRIVSGDKAGLQSLIAEDQAQASASPMSERTAVPTTNGEQPSFSGSTVQSFSQNWLGNTTGRSSSPTKGAGGFVQSASMKRSDSVTKSSSPKPQSISSLVGIARPTPIGQGTSSSLTDTAQSAAASSTTSHTDTIRKGAGLFEKTALYTTNDSATTPLSASPRVQEPPISPPPSPSKRWSPEKPTWIESAITKPESPKPSPSPRNSQPSWMTNIAKAKAQRANGDLSSEAIGHARSRSTSPTKEVFGQSILRRPEEKDSATPKPFSPTPAEQIRSRSASPTKVPTEPTAFASEASSTPRTPLIGSIDTVRSFDDKPLVPEKPDQNASTMSRVSTAPTPVTQKQPEAVISNNSTFSTNSAPKPQPPAKPQTDFRSNLKPRAQPESKSEEQPEFLSRFGNLRKTQTQNYVAPDVLKCNILRGKSELSKSDGPVKTERRDELKESLLAKKQEWKEDKDAGIVKERKVSQPPITPPKPEALAKRELLGRADGVKVVANPEMPRTATPEALAKQRSLKESSQTNTTFSGLQKQGSAPETLSSESTKALPFRQATSTVAQTPPTVLSSTETSKMAARFNPALAGVLGRGPPATTNGTNTAIPSNTSAAPSRSITPHQTTAAESAKDGQLQDMRKGRAKGPKRRKGDARQSESSRVIPEPSPILPEALSDSPASSLTSAKPQVEVPPLAKPKPRAPPGSAASLMMASLKQSSISVENPAEPDTTASAPIRESAPPKAKNADGAAPLREKGVSGSPSKLNGDTPRTIRKVPPFASKRDTPIASPIVGATAASAASVPEFRGFAASKSDSPMTTFDDNKENAGETLPSVKSAASMWGRQATPQKAQPPAPVKLPSKKDEEAAMKSAGLLASTPSRPGSSSGLGITVAKSNAVLDTPPPSAGVPPKPMKSSRAVSSQLLAAEDVTICALVRTFGSVPSCAGSLTIDTHAAITSSPHLARTFRTVRKSVQVVTRDGISKDLYPSQEYTFFDESVYICTHSYTVADAMKRSEIFLWSGRASSKSHMTQAETFAKEISRQNGNAPVDIVRQGVEPSGFLQALGGMLITRRGAHQAASKGYMLRGRRHLGQITFDEMDFTVGSLCSGFVYLISYPASPQETRLYLWKGSAASAEEISAARLAAADLSDDREVIEVDDGAEFSSFLKIFGQGTTKASIPKPSEIWQQKAASPDKFATRLFRISPVEAKAGIFSSIFTRRPSWGNVSPVRKGEDVPKVEAVEISPFAPSDLEADCIYLLDAYCATYVLVGPMFAKQAEGVRNLLFGQTLLFAADYGVLAVSSDDRPAMPKGFVLSSGVPKDLKLMFRHWDDDAGLWGGSGLIAGSSNSSQEEVELLGLNEVIGLVCKP